MFMSKLVLKGFKRMIIFSIVVFALILVIFNGDKSNAKTTNIKNFKCITISENDTLWSIANDNITEEYDDIKDYIDEVISINNLSGSKICSGSTLVVPYYTGTPQ